MSSLREKYLGTSKTSSNNTSLRQKYGLEKNSKYYKNIYEDELKKQKDIRKDIDTSFANQGVQTNTGYFTTQRNILPVQEQTEITKNKKFEVYDKPLEKNKEIKQKFQNIKNSNEYKKQEKNLIEQSNKVAYSKYDYDKAIVDEDNIGWYDKSLGTVVEGAKGVFDLGGIIKNDNGDVYSLPSKTEIKKEKVLNSYESKLGKVLGGFGYETGKIGATTLMNKIVPYSGTIAYYGRSFMDNRDSAIRDGYDANSANLYGIIGVGEDYITDKVLGTATKGLTGGKTGKYENVLKNAFSKITKNKTISKILSKASSEATEEFLQEYLDNINKLVILERSTNIKDYTDTIFSGEVLEDALYSAAVGAMTGGTIGTLSDNEVDINNSDNNVYKIYKSKLEETKKNTTNEIEIKKIDEMIEKIDVYLQNSSSNQIDNQITNDIETLINENKILSKAQNNNVLPTANNYQYTETDNQKINDLRKSATKYNLNNSSKTKSLLDVAKKLIVDKNYNIVFDDSIKSSAGNNVNAQITKNGNETIIKINPNSERAGEFLLVHEITHAIETDTMKQLVMDYASKNADFNNSLDSLKKTYGTDDVSDEVLADISGQLFGNQEFINSLSTSNPNIFVRIYYKIVSLANKITGNSQYSLFVKDLENKWRTAYTNNVNNILANNTKYMMTGLKGTKNAIKTDANNKFLMEAHNKAQSLKNEGKSNELIRQKTGWFQDKKGNWKFEISDADAKIISKLEKNRTYALKEVLKHDDLYEMYPELRELKVKFAKLDNPGGYRNSEKTILVNNNKLDSNNYNSVKGTLIHELQHAIQRIEKFPHGTSSIFGMKRYAKNLGEIEASDVRNRMNMKYSERLANKPETSKKNPKHPYEKQLLNKMGNVEKTLDKVYNLFKGESNEIYEENNRKNKENNLQIDDSMGRVSRRRELIENEELDNSSFSMQSDKWQEHLENNYKATGTRTILKGNRILNPVEISKLTKEDANTTPILPTIKVSTGTGESKFASNIEYKTNMLTDTSKDIILSDSDVNYYREVTNQESLEKAFEKLNKGGESEVFRWLDNKGDISSVDVAEGWILLKQYQDNIEKENNLIKKDELNRSMVQVAKKMREIGTKAGQTVQAFNILSRLTPEGMVYYAQSELSEAYNRMIKNKTSDWIEKHNADFDLKPEEVQFIMDTMQEVSKMEDGYDKKVKLAEIQKLMTDKLPPERGAGIKSWMRISMLFNPKTQVRNIMGNAVITPVNYFSDLVSSAVDSAIYKKTGVRTTGRTNLKSYGKGFKSGLYQSYNDFKKGINTRNIEGNRFEIKEGRSFNNNTIIGKRLNQVDRLLSFMLDAGDRGFYEASFTNSINNQMVLNKTNEVTQEMIDIATQEALSRTWQDNNDYTRFVLSIRKGFNKINVKGYGLGDILIPFAKTPANLTKAIVDYSPLGMVSTINEGIKLKRSLTNGQYTPQMQHQFVQNLGKATAGTMLYILGIALANAGITSGESDEDKDTANFMKNTLGINSYTIKIGNKSFSYDWAQPIAAPFAMTANLIKNQKEGATLGENITTTLDTGLNVLFEQSFLESISNVLSEPGEIGTKLIEQLSELPSRAIPTLMKQIVDLTDDTARTTFEYDKPLKTAVNKVVAKIPGLSKTLEPTTDTMGREILRYGGKNNIFNVFLNPANVSTENISESAKEIYNIYKSTGDKTILPRVAPYYINDDGEKIILSGTEKTQFQKISGTIIEDNVKMLENNKHYNSLSDIDKAEVINGIVNYAYNKARKDVLNIEMSNQYNKVNEWLDNGGTVYDYYANKEENNYSLENPKKYNTLTSAGIDYYDFSDYQKYISDLKDMYPGEENKNKRKNEIWKYIQNLNLTKAQKILIYNTCGGYGISNYKNYMHNYINSLKISKKEKEEIWDYLYG